MDVLRSHKIPEGTSSGRQETVVIFSVPWSKKLIFETNINILM